MRTKKLYIIIIFILYLAISEAQEIGFPIIRNYTPKEYNNAPQVWSVIQNSAGLMCFGVGGKVMEYDGKSWRNIPIDKQSSPRDLAMDRNGRIYVAASEEFGYLTVDGSGNTAYYSLTHLLKDSTLKPEVFGSVELTTECVYFRTYNAILQFTPNPESLQVFKADTNDRFDGDFVYQNVYYVRLAKKGLMKIENNKLIPANQSYFFKNKNSFQTAIPYDENTLLIPTRTDGLYLYQPNRITVPQKFTISDESFIDDNTIYNASSFQKENYVLGSLTKGVLLIDKKGVVLQHYQESNYLQDNAVYEITPDSSQNMWFGLSNGISKTGYSQDLSYWDKNANLKSSVTGLIRYNGTLYIASGINVYYIDKYSKIQEVKNIPIGHNWCFLETKVSKSLLVGTSKGIFEIQGDKAERIYEGNNVFSMYQSVKNPNRIMGADYPYFVSLIFKNGKWILEGRWKGINDNVHGIIEDDNGDVWLGTNQNGVVRVTPNYENITNPKKVRYYTQNAGFKLYKNILPFSFKNRIIWGTETGLYVYNHQTDHFEPFCELGKQFCNFTHSVRSLIEMPDGKIWVLPLENIKNDIGYLQPNGKDGYSWVYAPFRRIPPMFLEAIYIEPSGVVWLGGSEGLYRYDASKDTKNYTRKFNCLIRKITFGADSLLYGGNTPSTTLSEHQAIAELDYKFNTLEFEFAAPFFDNEEKTVYSYQLVGFDKEWSKWSREAKKEYTNLNEGKYTFQVKARNAYDVESQISTYQITILLPWYKTIWAYAGYIILSTIFIRFVVKLNTKRLRAANIKLEKIVKQRNAEVVNQAEELETYNEELLATNEELHYQREEILEQAEQLKKQNETLLEMDEFKQGLTSMIVHDLKNPLNLIINATKSINPERQIKLMQQSGRQMLNLVLNILDVHKYENLVMTINAEEKQLTQLAKSAIDQVHFLCEQKGVTIINRLDPCVVVRADEEIIERVLVNLFTNALKFTPIGGIVTISGQIKPDNRVLIKVIDTGEGIACDNMNLVFQKFGQIVAKKSGTVKSTGLGLTFCKMAVEAHGEEIGVSSEVGQGATFWFTLPLGDAGNIELQGMEKPEEKEMERIILTEEERRVLEPIIHQLKAFTVYETDDIEEIVAELKQNKSENIQKWVLHFQKSITTLNQIQFLELMRI